MTPIWPLPNLYNRDTSVFTDAAAGDVIFGRFQPTAGRRAMGCGSGTPEPGHYISASSSRCCAPRLGVVVLNLPGLSGHFVSELSTGWAGVHSSRRPPIRLAGCPRSASTCRARRWWNHSTRSGGGVLDLLDGAPGFRGVRSARPCTGHRREFRNEVTGHAGVIQNASSTRMGQTEARPLAGSISLRCVLSGTHIDDLADDAHPQPNLPALSHRLMDLSGRRTYLKPL